MEFHLYVSLNPILEVQLGIDSVELKVLPSRVSLPSWNWVQFSIGLVAGLIVCGPQGSGPCGLMQGSTHGMPILFGFFFASFLLLIN